MLKIRFIFINTGQLKERTFLVKKDLADFWLGKNKADIWNFQVGSQLSIYVFRKCSKGLAWKGYG